MDVTYGLLSSLVKTKSIERILAPIASQISLLIILNESEDGSAIQSEHMVPCSQAVMQASSKLITVAKQQAQSSSDKEFIIQTLSSCEVLDMSSSNLHIAAERMEASGDSREARTKLVQASKDVLQGTMKVLLVADDAEIRRLITATHIVTNKLSLLTSVQSMADLVGRFKDFTEALSLLTKLANKRQRDLTHTLQRERIITALGVLKKCVPSLSISVQNAVKYKGNPQAEVGQSYVVNEILSAIQDIVDAVQDHATDDLMFDLDEPGYFVTRIDQALDALIVDNREELHRDLEMWVECIVRHSMTVAHLCLDSHRDLIVKTCQRLIQVKARVVELHERMNANPDLTTIREDYGDVCETFIDELCELEKNVNVTLLHLVVDSFKQTTEPLETLVKKAVHPQEGAVLDHGAECIVDFEDHAEKMCQIASLAAASSTDAKRVRVIKTCVHRLEHLDPDIVPAVISLSKAPTDNVMLRNLKLLMKEWAFELSNIIQVLDEMTDPKMFMLVSERKVEEDINTCNGSILISDPEGTSQLLTALVGRSRRVAQVAERIVDSDDDPVYRNGLLVYIKQLRKAITAVRAAGSNLSWDFTNKTYQDTLRRRFTLLQDTLAQVTAGLVDAHHPHVLSPLRRNVRRQGSDATDKENKIPSKSHGKLESAVPKLSGGGHGNRFIATSVPRLQSVNLAVEEQIMPATGTSQKMEMSKSVSMSQAVQVGPVTHARRLAQQLLSWATKGDKNHVNFLCGDLLGWTNHIVEVTQTVCKHCSNVEKKREIEGLCMEVDEIAPQVIDKVKYVLHGDFSQLQDMKSLSDQWTTKVEKIRVFVDVTVERWKSLCDAVVNSAKRKKTDLVKQQLGTVTAHQSAITDLIMITEPLRWENQVKGQHKIVALLEDKDVLDNITVTLKTTAELISDQGLSSQLLQLEQLSREWSVKVYSIIAMLDSLTEEMLALGVERRVWGEHIRQTDVLQTLVEENTRLKDLCKSAGYGDEEKKELYRGFLADMCEYVAEIKLVLLRTRPSDVSSTVAMVTATYSKHKQDLYMGRWILKAVQCLDLVRQQTSRYSAHLDSILDLAFKVKAATHGQDRENRCSSLNQSLDQFSDDVSVMRKKVLQGIQLSSELSCRSVVRQCLDCITQIAPRVVQMVRTLADNDQPSDLKEVSQCRLLWCAKVRHIATALEQMSDIKPSLVTEILQLLDAADDTPNDTITRSIDAALSSLNLNGATIPTSKSVSSGNNIISPSISSHIERAIKPLTSYLVTCQSGANNKTDEIDFEPVTVDLQAIEEQIQLDAGKVESMEASPSAISIEPTSLPAPRRRPLSPVSAHSRPIMELLKQAEFIEQQTLKWEDVTNPIVKVARAMSTQIQQMTAYIRYQGPITNHMGLVQTAKALAENSRKILQFANILVQHCVDERFSDLKFYCGQIPTVAQQLLILSNVQLGTAGSDTADRVLVQNGQNLMKIILKTMDAAEAVCIKGLKPSCSKDTDHALKLMVQWKRRHIQHRYQQADTADQDDLGLRITEDLRSPALINIFQT